MAECPHGSLTIVVLSDKGSDYLPPMLWTSHVQESLPKIDLDSIASGVRLKERGN